mgnify:CR=1 FL=1
MKQDNAGTGSLGHPLRILHVLDHSLPLHSGYVFRTLSILKHQRALGWETFHVTSPKQGAAAATEEVIDGWKFYRSQGIGSGLAKMPAVGELALMRSLAHRIEEAVHLTSPDILHAHSPVLNALPALRVGRRHNLPVVYEVRAFWEDAAISHGTAAAGGLRYRLSRGIETYALRRADAVTTICEGLRQDIVARGLPADKVTVIPNAVDETVFAGAQPVDDELARRLGLVGSLVLGFAGSFYGYEGLDILLKAMPPILAALPDVRLLLVGGGPEDARLKALAKESGIEEQVIFTGRVPHQDVQKYYDMMDILAFPRRSIRLTELVTPLKPLESMAQEKLVLASDVGGHRELIVSGKTGYLFPPDDPQALAAAVLQAVATRDDWSEIRRRARRYIEEERNWRRSVANYIDVYGRLTGRPLFGVTASPST